MYKRQVKGVDASSYFISLLNGVSDPEKKRKVIGKAFIDVFDKESKLIDGGSAQGNNDLSPSVFKKVIQYFGKRTYPEPGLPLKQNVTTSNGEDPEQVGLEVGLQAQQFYDYLTNTKGDMVNIDMKIMGDPAFLGQEFALPMTDPGFGGSYDKKIQVGGVKGFEFDTEKGCFNFDNAEPVVSLDFTWFLP